MSLVEVENLSVTFGAAGGHAVVRGVSLTIAAGECVAMVGESGSGKSVIARSLLGLAGSNATVTADRMMITGRDVTPFGVNDWRAVRGSQVGLVLQDALVSLDPLRRIGTEIAEAVRLSGGHPDIADRVVELLTDVGVPEPEARRTQYPHQLSGGLRQRALIASALAGDPRLLIADEPTTALDVVVQAQILRLLARITATGRGLLLISHDLAVVAELADRVLVLRDGEVVEAGLTRQVIDEPAHAYTRQLIDSVPRATDRDVQPGGAVVLRAESVTKTYQTRRRRALDDVSFVLRAGESLGVVGESGAGKTTLARVIMGLLSPDSGRVLLDEQDWSAGPERARRRRRNGIQLVQQDPYAAFDPRFTVAQIVAEALPALGRRALRERVIDLLRAVELGPEFVRRRPHQLSGGQRQRIAIARALAPGPHVLVCDEPVSALDVSVQARVLDLLDTLRRETGIALVFITHDLAVVRLIADQVMIMKDGRVVERGPTGEVFDRPCHEYTRTLIASIPSLADVRQSRRAQLDYPRGVR
jgi:peptide/nickel transport system ATP-binding protein